VAGLVLLVAAVYWPVLGFDFVRWDDPVNTTGNALLREPWSWSLLVKLFNGDTALRFEPLTWLLYRGNHALFGFNPAAWHALGLGLHLLAVLLFHRVLLELLTQLRPLAPDGWRHGAALAGAAIWAVHPARVEPACWVTATPYPLLGVFLLASFWFYSRASRQTEAGARRRDFGVAWILALLGYASYPVGVTYGLWLMVADIWIFRTAPDWRAGWDRLLPWCRRQALFLLPAVASILVTWSSSSSTPWLYPAPPSFAEVGLLVRMKTGAAMLTAVGTHFVWPVGLTPNNPMLDPIQQEAPWLAALSGLALLAIGAVWLLRRRQPGVAGTVFGCTVLSLPVLGLLQWPSWSVADRHVYLPHLVLAGAMAIAAVPREPGRRWHLPPALFSGGLILSLALLSRRQVMIWRNTDTLFTYIEAQPAFGWNARQQAYLYLLWGAQAQEQNREQEARRRFDQARRVLQEGVIAAALNGSLKTAVEISWQLEAQFGLPPAIRRERGRWLLQLGRNEEAAAELARTVREAPEDAEAQKLLNEARRSVVAPPVAGGD